VPLLPLPRRGTFPALRLCASAAFTPHALRATAAMPTIPAFCVRRHLAPPTAHQTRSSATRGLRGRQTRTRRDTHCAPHSLTTFHLLWRAPRLPYGAPRNFFCNSAHSVLPYLKFIIPLFVRRRLPPSLPRIAKPLPSHDAGAARHALAPRAAGGVLRSHSRTAFQISVCRRTPTEHNTILPFIPLHTPLRVYRRAHMRGFHHTCLCLSLPHSRLWALRGAAGRNLGP